MKILIVTDAFPPRAGGSGWSTYELARALRQRGHTLVIVKPVVASGFPALPGLRVVEGSGAIDLSGGRVEGSPAIPGYDSFEVLHPHFWAPPVPFIRNSFKNERLYAGLSRTLERIIRERHIEIVHGQHLLSGPAAILAARRAGVVSLCTVRDYWPVCYWSDLMLDPAVGKVCPGCSAGRMASCVKPRGGWLWPLGIPAIPYMLANLRRKQQALASADAVVAVSQRMAADLRARGAGLAAARIEVIANPIDVERIRVEAARAPIPPAPCPGPYALYVGKLAPNKGSQQLLEAVRGARLDWPLVVVGDGPLRQVMEAEAQAHRVDVRFTGWVDRPAVLGWLRHASMLVFPSMWPEPFSRVLLEASALGVPIAAMDTGGTSEIVVDGATGLLARSVPELATAVARLRADADLRTRLGRAATQHVLERFDSTAVVAGVEALYHELLGVRP